MSDDSPIRLANTALTAWEKAVAEHAVAPPRRTSDGDEDFGETWVFDGNAGYRVHHSDEVGLNRVRILPDAIYEMTIGTLLPTRKIDAEVSPLCKDGGALVLIVPLEEGAPPVWVSRKLVKVLAAKGLNGWRVRLQPPTLTPFANGEAPHSAPVLFWGPGDDVKRDLPRMIVMPVRPTWEEHQVTVAVAAAWLETARPKGGTGNDTDGKE